jgi:hypothetical protein
MLTVIYAEGHFMLSVTYKPFMLSDIMLNVFMQNVIMPSVVAPTIEWHQLSFNEKNGINGLIFN